MHNAASITFALVSESKYLHFIPSSNNNPLKPIGFPLKLVGLFNFFK